MLRNVAGLTGIGLLCATVLGASLAWTGPLAYLRALLMIVASSGLWFAFRDGDGGWRGTGRHCAGYAR